MTSHQCGGMHARQPTYLELIRRGARQHADRVAVVFGEESLSFSQVDALSSQLAHALYSQGIKQNDRVALLLNNGLLSVPLDFACVKAGLNRVPLNARLSVAEHVKMLQETGCIHLIFGAGLEQRAAQIKAELPALCCLGLGAAMPGSVDLGALASRHPAQGPDIEVQPDDIVLTLFTSGTTGTLKAAQHSQASFASICRNVLLNLLPATADDAMLHAASLIHASGVFVLPFWLRGGRTVIVSSFEPGRFLAVLQAQRITAINLVPTMLQMLLEHPDFTRVNVSALKYVIYGASPMPRSVLQKAMEHWGTHRFWQYYGQTEVPLCLAVLRPEDHTPQLMGSACGQPCLDVELRLLDEQGRDVAPGEPGEITVRAPSAVRGYYNAPQLNEDTFTPDGWVRTRDMGLLDAQGFLHLKDRKSDMIITGGYNGYPLEVENALLTHPAVRECVVLGLPHDKWVEVVTAAVVLRDGAQSSEQELVAHVATQLASYKKPQQVIFVQEIAKTAVGKLNRRAMRERLKPQ